MGRAARGETMIFVCIICLNKSRRRASRDAVYMAEAARGFGDVVLPSSGGEGNRAASMEKTFQEEKIFRFGCPQTK